MRTDRGRLGAIGVVWLLALLVGGAVAVAGLGRLDQSFTATGGPGHRANQEIHARYGNGAAVPPLVAVAAVRDRAAADRFAGAVARAAGPDARTLTRTAGGTAYALVHPGAGKPDLAGLTAVEDTARALRAAGVEVTGVLPLTADSAAAGPGPPALVLKGACALGFLGLLAWAFRSPLGVLAPLVLAATVSVAALLLVEAVASAVPVSFVVVYPIPVTALVVMVRRWARPPGGAVTGAAAGAAAFTALACFPAVFLRSIGIAGAAVCVVGAVVTLTLDPLLRSAAGAARSGRSGASRRRAAGRMAAPTAGGAAGHAAARRVAVTAAQADPGRSFTSRRLPGPGPRRAWSRPVSLVAFALLLLCAGAAPLVRVGNPEARALVAAGPAREGLDRLEAAGVATGVLNPLEVLVPSGAAGEVVRRASVVPGVRFAAAPSGPGWRRGGTALVVVVPEEEPMTPGGARTVEAVRAALAGTGALVGGSGVVDRDLVDGDYGLLPYAVPVVALVAFGVLVRRQRRTAARSLLGALLAAAAAAGGPVLLWQFGPGGTGAVTGWVPLVVGAFAFCVSLERSAATVAAPSSSGSSSAGSSSSGSSSSGSSSSPAGATDAAGLLAAGAGALAVLAAGIGPQVELALLVSAFALTALLDAVGGRVLAAPAARSRLTPWSSPQLV
ncbi:hypothetical protein ACIRSU_15580 [Streptomyces sp. NPDC101160]|uniref:hypothetical protein n=1 Tax=Streptomyces sp. NPDC101160 TaxID=3366118 RepID=UPI0037FED1D7